MSSPPEPSAFSRIPLRYNRGIHLPEVGLWLDPWSARDYAFVSHAHSDHFARHGTILCTKETGALLETRFPGKYQLETRTLNRPWTLDGHRITLLPAGHILGSAQIHIERLSDGASLLYTGDFKLRASRTAEKARALPADVLIMETTFALPQFRFPSLTKTRNAMERFCRAALDNGEVPVLLAYSLGKAQEILAQLSDCGFSFLLHSACTSMTRVYESLGFTFPPHETLTDESDATGRVLIVPPNVARSQLLRKLGNRRVAMCTGWALTPGAKYRYQVNEVFPLSDHADYEELLEYVKLVNPKLVFTTHGYAGEFARDLRERGIEAWSLGVDDQMELSLGINTSAELLSSAEPGEPAAAPESEFGRFVTTCDAIGATAGRLKKTSRLASWFRRVETDDLAALGALFYSGRPMAPEEAKVSPPGTSWPVIRLALQQATGINPKKYRDIAASLDDTGRTAFLLLVQGGARSTPRPWKMEDLSALFRRLALARGPLAKVSALDAAFRQMTPAEGQYLVKILTGDLRIGLTDALIEEAIAEAWTAPVDQVREAHMLTGDLAETARLARRGTLDSAMVHLFQPLQPTTATPVASAAEVWERLTPPVPSVDLAPERDDLASAEGLELWAFRPSGETAPAAAAQPPPAVWLEPLVTGIRAQLHKGPDRAELFARDLRRLTREFPELQAAARALDGHFILDGMILAWSAGRLLDLASLLKQDTRRQPDLFMDAPPPVRFLVFDLLWHNGESLLSRPLSERRERLDSLALPAPFELTPVTFAAFRLDIDTALKSGPLLAKDPASPCTPGRKNRAWLKLSPPFAASSAPPLS